MASTVDRGDAARLNSQGMQALERGDARAALEHFALATRADPSATALWMNLAKAHRQLGDADGEGTALDRALETDQRHFMALVRRAELHERLGEDASATVRWTAVLALAAGIDQRTPMLNEMLARARAYVAERSRRFEAAIGGPLDRARTGLDAVELRRFDTAVDHLLGKRRIYHNECAGFHVPFLPADEFFERRHFPWLAAFEARTEAICGEFEALFATGDGFAPYVSQEPGTPSNKWSALNRSTDWSAFYLWRMGERDDTACARCPETAAALALVPLAELPGRAPTAFFSVLKPRTRIPPHTGVSNTRAVVHLPLVVPKGCGFRVGGETRQWLPGEAFAFDDTIEHEAWNDSDQPRAVLIVDVWNPHLTMAEQSLVREFYQAADASGHNPEPRQG